MGGGIEQGGDEHALHGRDSVDVTTPAFARRLANLLAARRWRRGCSLRGLARQSHRAFTARDLRAYEEAALALDEEKVEALADLYGIDLDEILVERVGLSIDPDGVLSTSGLHAAFSPDDDVSLLTAYLRLVRQMRAQQGAPTIQLRREDVEVLAEFVGESGPGVIDRLGALMGATATQRRAMAGMFLAGAVVIGFAGGTVTAMSTHGGPGGGGSATAAAVTVLEPTADAADVPSAPADREISWVTATTSSVAPASDLLPATTLAPADAPSSTAATAAPIVAPAPVVAPAPSPAAPRPAHPATTVSASGTEATSVESTDVPAGGVALAGEAAQDGAGIFATDVPTIAAPIAAPTTTTARDGTDPTDTAAPAIPGGELPLPDVAVAPPPMEPSTPPVGG